MMTVKELTHAADRYGADLNRWPPPLQEHARTLLSQSPPAQAILEKARALDQLIEAASRHADSRLWHSPLQKEAALSRLRAGVAARIAQPARAPAMISTGAGPLRWLTWAAAGSIAVCAGFILGSLLYGAHAASPVESLLTALQPVPIQLAGQ